MYNKDKKERLKIGQFFTTQKIADILKQEINNDDIVCDPACGEKILLKGLINKTYGFDIDTTLNCIHMNWLEENENYNYDTIIMNPPYGAEPYKSQKLESFELFLKKAMSLDKVNKIIVLLPITVSYAKKFKNIRDKMYNYGIKKYIKFSDKIPEVLSELVGFVLQKGYNNKIIMQKDDKIIGLVNKDIFKKTDNHNFIFCNEEEYNFISKMYDNQQFNLRKYNTFKGIVTGNNKKYIKNNGDVKIYRGKNIIKNKLLDTNEYIDLCDTKYYNEFKQDLFLKDKIVWNYIGERIEFYLDKENNYFLNSAYMLFGDNLEELIKILNSNDFNNLYKLLFNDIKHLPNNIKEVPLNWDMK